MFFIDFLNKKFNFKSTTLFGLVSGSYKLQSAAIAAKSCNEFTG